MDLCESWALLTARQHPEAIRRALDEHGIPDHLWGLLDWLVGVAHDVPPHSRPDGYTEIMAIVDQAFDHDPINPPHSSTTSRRRTGHAAAPGRRQRHGPRTPPPLTGRSPAPKTTTANT